MKLHLDLACEKVQETHKTIRDLSGKLQTLQKELEEKRKEDQENASKEKIVMVKNETSDLPGVFLWKINDFSKILRQARTGGIQAIQCTPFYTESYGYKLKARINPNGAASGWNTYLSVSIAVMKGEYDAILSWPFKKKVKFTLIDQQEDPANRENVTEENAPDGRPKCCARPTREGNAWLGSAKFISHEKLHTRRYLVDDTLFLQVEIGP